MPAMSDDEKSSGKKKGVDLAIVFGGKGDDKEASGKSGGDDGGGDEDLPPGFEEAYSEAFPDAPADKEQMMALKRLIHLCSDSY